MAENIIRIRSIHRKHAPCSHASVRLTMLEMTIMMLAVHFNKNVEKEDEKHIIEVITNASRNLSDADDMAVVRMKRSLFNLMCISVLDCDERLRYVEAANGKTLSALQDKLVCVMNGFRSGEYGFIGYENDSFFVCYENRKEE